MSTKTRFEKEAKGNLEMVYFIMPVGQRQFFAVALEKGIYLLKYISVIGFGELNKLAINSNYLALILFVRS